jgi:hypothetical protein
MKRLLSSTAALALAVGLGAGGSAVALAQEASTGYSYPSPAGPSHQTLSPTPEQAARGATASPGPQYRWVYGYDHHANYVGHWQPVRSGS